jgi:alpha-tubulin suppressor-like RCC1 family protein
MKQIKTIHFILFFLWVNPFFSQNRKADGNYNSGYAYLVCDSTAQLLIINLTNNTINLTNFQNVSYIHVNSVGNIMVLRKDSTIWMKGVNYYGQLGDSTNSNSSVFVQVKKLTQVIEISAGNNLSGCVKSDGSVWVWGYRARSFSSNGTGNSNYPLKINAISNARHISISDEMIFVLKNDSTVWRIDTTGNVRKIVGLSGIIQIEALNGLAVVAALDKNGKVWVYGNYKDVYPLNLFSYKGYIGYYGDGKIHYSDTLVHLIPISNIKKIRESNYSFMVMKNNGTLWRWGGVGYDNMCFGFAGGYYYYFPFFPTLHYILNPDSSITEYIDSKLVLKQDGSIWKEKCADKNITKDTTHYIGIYDIIASHPCAVAGIKEWAHLMKKLNIIPNPTSSSITIQTLDNSPVQSILIKDLTGKILLQQSFPASSHSVTLDVSALSDGLYLCEVHTNVSVVTEKIIVQR